MFKINGCAIVYLMCSLLEEIKPKPRPVPKPKEIDESSDDEDKEDECKFIVRWQVYD